MKQSQTTRWGTVTKTVKPPFPIPKRRFRFTDHDRIYSELLDLPFKPAYKTAFKVEVRSSSPEDLQFPILHVKFGGKWYPFQLVLVGYPDYIDGYFLVIPPCPIHGGRHPHVFSTGDVCWTLEQRWKKGMMLYEDYITFLMKILQKPKEHVLCRI